ncbi:acetyl-CoA C-acetyltransferase [Streptosporangium sp. NPDC002544]|uniref:acetyl-CoA C-acetyltransferase n=1 Tax=Streptosporangium sp. NPDC002544 TaxID=3154538 RepID=UPI003325C15F
MPDAVIVAATRSPIGRAFKGSLRTIRPDELTRQVVAAALAQVPALRPETLDDLLLGCGRPGGEQGFNMGRVVSVLLGTDSVPATTVTRYCASSLQTTRMALHAIRAGEGHAFVSAGVECVSRSRLGSSDNPPIDTGADPLERTVNPWTNPVFAEAKARSAARARDGAQWTDPRIAGELPDVYLAMGQTAENVAGLCGVSRHDQDEFAVRSQNLAERAANEGVWAREITPVTLPDGSVVTDDDGPRRGVTYDGVAALPPVFRPGGTVTAGNCCALNDGAAAVVVTSDRRAAELGLTPLARIVSTAVSSVSPEIMGLGPVEATRRALHLARLTIGDIDLVELNEAFAAQVLACQRELGIDMERLNVRGGAIALGHPFGMTGARITTTLVNALQARDGQFGLETMCVGGGQGMAMVIERLS